MNTGNATSRDTSLSSRIAGKPGGSNARESRGEKRSEHGR
jgi:hypothetical protein